MKKIVSLAFAAAALVVASASAQEVTYVEDCSQGLLQNKAKDNWFLTAEGGANFLVGEHDIHTPKFVNRIGARAGLYVGKWVNPNFGFRFGANWNIAKGATTENGMFRKMNEGGFDNGYYPERFMTIGPEFGVMVNLTNWWCGYKPNRVYNSNVIFGAGFDWTQKRAYGAEAGSELHWRNAHYTQMFAFVAWQNSFRLSDVVDIFIEPRAEMVDFNEAVGIFSLNAGLTFNFGNNDWNCPVTAVCPTWKYTDAEGDALVAKLEQQNAKIADLQRQLDECLRRPVQTVAQDCEGLVTVYYPINQSSLSSRERTILKSVANVMQNNPNKTYVLTGWADNYTGTDEINVRLRNARVDGVKKYLEKCGVNPSQLEATIDNGNLTDFGAKCAPLDRAVTIREK